ncbi:MAG TPA: maleylacetoacetate isomerase [Arenimonas sp.]|uniref:maleylacetoacetate isomerase n=1 Tax=Arenimonas sp. TaxID=1872635 RepID=UPI002C372836|nr:maleylacetoacetate isomerase [Arenimonas sp.]HMB58218.1 maleylacetoacetate isomerase [Arenimonas sp.]
MTSDAVRLYSYWRSSAAYRVRIALNLKGLEYETLPVHLVRDGGEQHTPAYREVNPQELVPVLLHGNRVLRQSQAIIEYIDETWATAPALMPAVARDRQQVRAIAQLIACDIHPLGNLRVQQYLEQHFGASQEARDAWVRHWVGTGMDALEHVLGDNPSTGDFCEGEAPSLADCCLVPQVYNANRFGVDMKPYPTIARINAHCLELPAFDAARPEKQPDAPAT